MPQPGERVEITRADDLYRRLSPDHVKNGIVVSNAYNRSGKPDPEISVGIARLIAPEEMLRDRPDFGVGVLPAHVPLDLGLAVRHDPLPGWSAHALILNPGDLVNQGRQKQLCRLLADATRIIIAPKPRASAR